MKVDDDALTLIARASEGSVRDSLSILDQAMALGAGTVNSETVRAMLGLADKTLVFEILDHVFNGKTANALELLDKLYHDGADPLQLLSDMAEDVHSVTRIKVAGNKNLQHSMSETELSKAKDFANRLSITLLGRAWQMMLKGLSEVENAPQPIAAVEMILVRMAHTADLPASDEIIKTLQGHSVSKEGSRSHQMTKADHKTVTGRSCMLLQGGMAVPCRLFPNQNLKVSRKLKRQSLFQSLTVLKPLLLTLRPSET